MFKLSDLNASKLPPPAAAAAAAAAGTTFPQTSIAGSMSLVSTNSKASDKPKAVLYDWEISVDKNKTRKDLQLDTVYYFLLLLFFNFFIRLFVCLLVCFVF